MVQGWDVGVPKEPGTERQAHGTIKPAASPSIAPPWTIDLANDNKQTNKSSFGGRRAGEGPGPA